MENIHERIINEVEKVIRGKREVIEKIMMAVMADGHVLLDDVPGTGKTTMAVSLSRALGVKYHRIQYKCVYPVAVCKNRSFPVSNTPS